MTRAGLNSRHLCGLTVALLLNTAALGAHASNYNVLYDYGVVQGGRNPQAALTLAPDGAYYGTTTGGGATGNGTVFKLVPPAGGQTNWSRTVIHSFSGAVEGANPSSGLLFGTNGALFGVTAAGGVHGEGVAYALVPPAGGQQGWTETVLHDFTGSSDGAVPYGMLVQDAAGILYGSAVGGGASGNGVVFSLSPPASGQAAWTETTLYSFQSGQDGISPAAGVFLDGATGVIVGMTSLGGLNQAGEIYSLTPPAAGGSIWTKATLYDFRGGSDGSFPVGALVRDGGGTFYGVTAGGGTPGDGTAFSLSPRDGGGKGWVETVIHPFSGGLDGTSPSSTPVLGPDGTLYGVANGGGNVGSGAAFALTPPAKGRLWTATPLASFDGPNGSGPFGLTLGANGLIGATQYGGTRGDGGGTLYTLTPPSGGTGWTQNVISQFSQTSRQPSSPLGALLMGKGGVLYGSASAGGAHGQGAVFAMTPPAHGAAAWQQTLLHSFDGRDGAQATGQLLQGPNGVLYGVATSGGPKNATPYGVVYALLPPASGQTDWTAQVLHAFTGVGNGDGAFPASGLVADANGALYGTAGSGGIATGDNTTGNGIVYQLTPPTGGKGAWNETVLYRFSGPDGSTPQGSLSFDAGGALYGTTYVGGAAGEGTVFRLTPPPAGRSVWTETVLHSFDASTGNDGAIPGTEQLLIDGNGAIYGTASQGGAHNYGAVFELTPPAGTGSAWTETLLHSFDGNDGAFPYVGLTSGSDGALFGAAEQGGEPPGCQSFFGSGCGTVFKLVPPKAGKAWTLRVLHDFNPAYGADGSQPAGALIRGPHGKLFGTTAGGGFGGGGILFDIAP